MDGFVLKNFRVPLLCGLVFISLALFIFILNPTSSTSDDPINTFEEVKFNSNEEDRAALPLDTNEDAITNSDSGIIYEPPEPPKLELNADSKAKKAEASASRIMSKDWRMHGLISPQFEKASCVSRFESFLYHKTSPHKPSSYLIAKLRSYETLHKVCGPGSLSFNRSIERLKSKRHDGGTGECKYIVWVPSNGMGNRLMSLASTFLYGLLTDPVLLLDSLAQDMADLLCEPFPLSTWLLPDNFPINDHITREVKDNEEDYQNVSSQNVSSPQYIYLNTDRSDYVLDQTPFHCEQIDGMKLQNAPWLILLSDQYYIPYFFLTQPYRDDVELLFPRKDVVFHLIAKYLFNPSNEAWGYIMRFYHAYLAKADERIGLQVRVFSPGETPLATIMDQIHACAQSTNLLPEVDDEISVESESFDNRTSKAILITSLHSDIYRNLSATYLNKPTRTSELIEIYQPSHEEQQRFQDKSHDMKAWGEIYLLSMTDVLVTSAWSTFGYAAQGLSGASSWFLVDPHGSKVPNPACIRHTSMEPCHHYPPVYDCKKRAKYDPGKVLPYLKHCSDVKQGVQLVNIE